MIELNKVYKEDCLEGMKNIYNESIDMICTDMPYGMTRCAWDTDIDLGGLWKQFNRIIKPHGVIAMFSAQPFTTDLINSNRKLFRYEIIWEKTTSTNFLNANKMPLRIHENILIFYKHLPTYIPQKKHIYTNDIGRIRIKKRDRAKQYGCIKEQNYVEDGSRYPTDVVKFSNWNGVSFGKDTENRTVHNSQKPLALIEYLIKTYSNENDLILDPFIGSGTTAVACRNTGRRYIGYEIDENYYQIAKRRIAEEAKSYKGE